MGYWDQNWNGPYEFEKVVDVTAEWTRAEFTFKISDHYAGDPARTYIGISPEELPKVLDKFFRSADPRVRERTGSGLGLSLANEIVRLHGGKLLVHSELNKGSKFTVIIPTSPEGAQCSNAQGKARLT